MSINDATNVAAAAAFSSTSAVAKTVAKTFTNNIFAKTLQNLTRKRYKCYYGKAFDQLPNDELSELSPEVCAHYSGPDTGINDVSLISQRRLLQKQSTVVCNKPILEKGVINISLDETNLNDQSNEKLRPEIKITELNGNHDINNTKEILNGNFIELSTVLSVVKSEGPVLNGNHDITNGEKSEEPVLNGNHDITKGEKSEEPVLNENHDIIKGENEAEIISQKGEMNVDNNYSNFEMQDLKEYKKVQRSPKSFAPKAPIKSENALQSPQEENTQNLRSLEAKNETEDDRNGYHSEQSKDKNSPIDPAENQVNENISIESNNSQLFPKKIDEITVDIKVDLKPAKSVVEKEAKIDKNLTNELSGASPKSPRQSTIEKLQAEVKQKTFNLITEQTLANECWDSFSRSKILHWNRPHPNTYGIACSLYENNLINKTQVGDPIADVYAVLTRQNSSIMILADGVNWGPRSRLAARCAVRASMNYINKHMFFPPEPKPRMTTHDVFTVMMRSFDAAQEFILQKKGTMTTLCCSVVLKLKEGSSSSQPLWAVCTLSIGDSTAYVFNKEKGVLELTYGARNINDDRDMRNVGGALGHVYGRKPDVSNLNYSFMYIKEGDIVFLVSDGISDNFDPCVSHTASRKPIAEAKRTEPNEDIDTSSRSNNNNNSSQPNGHIHRNSLISFASAALSSYGAKKTSISQSSQKNNQLNRHVALSADEPKIVASTLPQLNPNERYICGLAHMNEVLLSRRKQPNSKITAHETCSILVDHVVRMTSHKRSVLEKGLLEAASLEEEERKRFQATLRERAMKLRGKLDHASIVAYDVGVLRK